jgi:hypothetical protein
MSSDLQKRLEAINALPPRDGGQFNHWLKQEDAFAFLESNADDKELVVFASLRFTFVHAVLVPNATLDPLNVNDLLKWSCSPHETWGFWASQDTIGISPPLDHPGSETLIHGEQLVFTRRFEARINRKSYVEALQKFTHMFDLHYVAERDSYCRLDEHGDIEDMIKIVKIASKDEMGRGRYVTFNQRLLDEYMLVTDTSLVRLFDFTRNGSYSRGFQIIRTNASAEAIRRRLWGTESEKQYATFIAHDWKHKCLRMLVRPPASRQLVRRVRSSVRNQPGLFQTGGASKIQVGYGKVRPRRAFDLVPRRMAS